MEGQVSLILLDLVFKEKIIIMPVGKKVEKPELMIQ